MRRWRALGVGLLATAVVVTGVGPAGAQEAEPPTLGLVGDSIPLQAFRPIGEFVRRERRIAFSRAGLGYEVNDVLARTRAALLGDDPPDIFVAFIGTAQSHNDPPAVWERELRALLDQVSPRVDCVRVFEIDDDVTGFYRTHDRNAGAYNRITRRLTAQYDNAEWFHYERWAALAGPDLERQDTLHHRLEGQREVGKLVRDVADSCDPALTTGPYWDVPDRDPAAEAIAWVGEQGLFPGYPNGTYRARIGSFTIRATRGQLLDMVWRLAGAPRGFPDHRWTDGHAPYGQALRWADATGVGRGFPDGSYRPDRPVTRREAMTLLFRLADPPDDHPDDPWSDADGPAARWAAAVGLFPGVTDGTLDPGTPLTRAALAKLLFRYAAISP